MIWLVSPEITQVGFGGHGKKESVGHKVPVIVNIIATISTGPPRERNRGFRFRTSRMGFHP